MKQGFRIIWIMVSIGFISYLINSIYDLSKRGKVVEEARSRLAVVQERNAKLIAEKEYVQSPAFVEQEARNKLNLARPDEIVAIVPQPSPILTPVVAVSEKQNWEQWMETFRIAL